MRRSPLARKSPPSRRHPIRTRARRRPENTPERQAWKEPRAGFCQCGCGRYSQHLEHHHVTDRALLVREGRADLEWDPRNGMFLHELCHSRHTSAFRRVALPMVPDEALAFAVEFFGDDGRAADWLRSRYAAEVDGEEWTP